MATPWKGGGAKLPVYRAKVPYDSGVTGRVSLFALSRETLRFLTSLLHVSLGMPG